MTGFCPHFRAIPGLDAFYCPDCHRSIERGSADYNALVKKRAPHADEKDALIGRLRQEVDDLRRQLDAAQNTIRRTKDINPVQRPSLKRVLKLKLVFDACMSLQKLASGWLLKLGNRVRRFKLLLEIWELLIADDWILGEIFPLGSLISTKSNFEAITRAWLNFPI